MLRRALGTNPALKPHQAGLYFPALQTWRQLESVQLGKGMPSVGKISRERLSLPMESCSKLGLAVCQPFGDVLHAGP